VKWQASAAGAQATIENKQIDHYR